MAQETPIWTDMDCAQSKIVAPAGLKCRATQEFTRSDSPISGANGGGIFRRWVAFGVIGGNKLYYQAAEAIGPEFPHHCQHKP
jgi:hypothetical protein